MEISPIAGIRVASVLKQPPPDPELSIVVDIRNPEKSVDDTYSGSSNKNAGGGEDEDAEPIEDPVEPESSAPHDTEDSAAQISLFA